MRFMSLRFLALCVLLTSMARAQVRTPEETARAYMSAMRSGEMETVALYMHPSALQKFKDILVQFAARMEEIGAADDPKSSSAIRVLFGDIGVKGVKDAEPRELFVRFLSVIQKAAPVMRQVLADSTYEFVGHVDESGNQTHVVYRATLSTAGAEVTKMEVLTLRREGEQWGVMLTGDIENLATGLSREFEKKPAPTPATP